MSTAPARAGTRSRGGPGVHARDGGRTAAVRRPRGRRRLGAPASCAGSWDATCAPSIPCSPPSLPCSTCAGDPGRPTIRSASSSSSRWRSPAHACLGGDCVRLRLSELMFVEVVRRHLATLPAEERGGSRDCGTRSSGARSRCCTSGQLIAWTPEGLAGDVAAHRAPSWRIASPTSWGTRRCSTSRAGACRSRRACSRKAVRKVSAAALEVGYDSEAAFSRAFKLGRRRSSRRLAPPPCGARPALLRQAAAARPRGHRPTRAPVHTPPPVAASPKPQVPSNSTPPGPARTRA